MAGDAKRKRSGSDWRAKCVDRFGLQDVPATWHADKSALAEHYRALSLADDATWKRYHEFRLQRDPREEEQEESEESDEDESGGLGRKASALLEDAVRAAGGGDGPRLWERHAAVRLVDAEWDGGGDLRSSAYGGCVFSPFALPRCLLLTHRFHHRSRYSSVEYFAAWSFELVRFDGEAGGDATQRRLARQFPEGVTGAAVSFHRDGLTAVEEKAGVTHSSPGRFGREDLCSISLLDPPSVRGLDDADVWEHIYDIDDANLNSLTVRRFRSWLFGSACPGSHEFLSDWQLVQLVFASCGSSVEGGPIMGDVGYQWPGWEDKQGGHLAKELVREGVLEPPDNESEYEDMHVPNISWLQRAARVAAGAATRPIDGYYQPYDLLGAKAAWGKKVLDMREERNMDDEDEGDEDTTKHDAPWVVWERAEKGGDFGGGEGDALAMMMGLFGKR